MSREQNELRRDIERELVEMMASREWMEEARRRFPFVRWSESLWLEHGDVEPRLLPIEMLGMSNSPFDDGYYDHDSFPDDEDEEDWEDDDWEDDWEDDEDGFSDPDDRLVETLDVPDELLEFGGRLLPAEDVKRARELLFGTTNA